MKKLKEKLKYGKKGITLIALVITIVILIILATITVNFLFGENGLINRAQQGSEEYNKSDIGERVTILQSEFLIEKASGEEDDFADFLRKELQVGVAQDEEGNYNFAIDGWQVEATENEVISIERLNINPDKVYPNVASMKADTGLTEGELVQTESYWDKQYGGSAYYDIVSSTSLTVDDGKCIQLDNGLYAELHPINDTVTVNQFGAYGDGEHDDANSIQLALNAGYENVTFENDDIYISSNTIIISSSELNILGNSATIKADNFNFSDNYFIYLNGGSSPINNVYMNNINIEIGNTTRNNRDAVSLQVRDVNNLTIENCNFNVPEINENKDRNITNIWILSGNNINIESCKFSNLSGSEVGGCIWVSDSFNTTINNISIKDNYIEKHSADEIIALFGGKISNVNIINNTIYSHEENLSKNSVMCMTIGSGSSERTENITIKNNKFNCESTGGLIWSTNSQNITVEQNEILFNNISSDESSIVFRGENANNYNIINNKIEINANSEDEIQYCFYNSISNISNNTIIIRGNCQTVFTLLPGNSITSNYITNYNKVNCLLSSRGANFSQNILNIEGEVNNIFELYNLSANMNIEENEFKCLSESIRAMMYVNQMMNNFDINFEHNTIENSNSNSYLVDLRITDITPQNIYIRNNKLGVLQKIAGNSTGLHNVVLDSNS